MNPSLPTSKYSEPSLHSVALNTYPKLEVFTTEAIKYGSSESTSDLLSKALRLMATILDYSIPRITPIDGNRLILEWWNKQTNKTLSLELLERKDRVYWWTLCGNVSTDRKEGELSSFISEVLLPFISDTPKSSIEPSITKLRAIDLPRA